MKFQHLSLESGQSRTSVEQSKYSSCCQSDSEVHKKMTVMGRTEDLIGLF